MGWLALLGGRQGGGRAGWDGGPGSRSLGGGWIFRVKNVLE